MSLPSKKHNLVAKLLGTDSFADAPAGRIRLILLLFIVFLLTPLFFGNIYSNYEHRAAAAIDVQQHLALITELARAEHKTLVEEAHELLFEITVSKAPASLNEADCSQLLSNTFAQGEDNFSNFGVIKPDGSLLCTSLPVVSARSASFGNERYFQEAVDSKTFSVSDFTIDKNTNVLFLTFAYPVFHEDGTLEGVAFATAKLSWLQNFIQQEAAFSQDIVMQMIEPGSGNVLLEYPENISLSTRFTLPPEVLDRASQTNQSYVFESSVLDGVDRIFFVGDLTAEEGSSVLINIGFSKASVLAHANGMFEKDMLVLVGLLLASLFAAFVATNFFVARRLFFVQEVNRLKTEFVSIVAHQLKTPITAIKWNIETLADATFGRLTKKQRTIVEDVQEIDRRLLELIDDLLRASRIDLGSVSFEPVLTSITEISDGVLKEFVAQAKEKNIRITKKYERRFPKLTVDVTAMRIVFQNLISNAIKYTPKDGEVTVTLRREGAQAIISVTDTGYGIPFDEQGHIFEKFYRASNVKGRVKGTGLGLSIVKTVLKQTGGEIRFKSEEERGTTFTVSIPLSGMKQGKDIKGA